MHKIDLVSTYGLCQSDDHEERLVGEYLQAKIRYQKLKRLNRKIEAAQIMKYSDMATKIEEPEHDSPREVLEKQEADMREYLHDLEIRAIIKGIDLDEEEWRIIEVLNTPGTPLYWDDEGEKKSDE